jgi:uncharacterized protein (TIGR02996 family)
MIPRVIRQELLDAIAASPDDDAPRRVYADALLDAGEPQGELIHLQCELAAGSLTRDEAVARRRRERELLLGHGARWTEGLRAIARAPVFRRGFVDEVTVDTERFPEVGDRVFAAAPALRGVRFEGPRSTYEPEQEVAGSARLLSIWQRAIACPAMRRVRGFGYGDFGYVCRVFGEVTPGWESLGDPALVALLATDTSRLDCLDAYDSGYRGHEALFASAQLARLTRLALWSQGLNDTQDFLRALAGSRVRSLTLIGDAFGVLADPVYATLTELRVQAMDPKLAFATDRLERFAFATETIRDDHVAHLVASLHGVRELALDGDRVPGYRQLAQAELPRLRILRVHGSDIGRREAEEILQMPCAAQLEVLQLARISDPDRAALEQRFGVIVEVVDAKRPHVYWH